jgi:hypothetical protein
MAITSLLMLATLVVPQSPAGGLAEALTAGDACYARRAEGAQDGVARPEVVEAAIGQYRTALALDRRSYAARLGLLRGIFFRTGFCGEMDPRDKQEPLDEAKALAEETVRMLQADLALAQRNRTDLSREIPVAQIYLWSAVSWGQWIVFHKLAAVWQGAPRRIRELAEAAVQIDPAVDQAGGLLILGRLHAETPHVPLLTGWVSRTTGIQRLRDALALAPDNPACLYFLANALLELEPDRREEARQLLRRCMGLTPRPAFAVEDAHYAAEARARMARLNLRM